MTEEQFEAAKELKRRLEELSNRRIIIANWIAKTPGDNDCKVLIRGKGEIGVQGEIALRILKEELGRLGDEFQETYKKFREL